MAADDFKNNRMCDNDAYTAHLRGARGRTNYYKVPQGSTGYRKVDN